MHGSSEAEYRQTVSGLPELVVAAIITIKILVVNGCDDGSTWEGVQDMRGCSEAE